MRCLGKNHLALLAAFLLTACATELAPLDVQVTAEDFIIGGQAYPTTDALVQGLRARNAVSCRLQLATGVEYRRVKEAVEALRDAGCSTGIVGGMAP